MTPYPKHYLADVPHNLRMRVLDLCIRREWHDALDLLHQNGFTQYECHELVWFHDHAPTNLPLVTGSTGDPPVRVGDPPAGIPTDREPQTLTPVQANPEPETPNSELAENLNGSPASSIQEPTSAPLTLTPPCSSVLSASSVLKSSSLKPKRRRPRSKACRLPADVQLGLNTMLARGCRYRDIIRSLNTRGYPGFNKVNLNTWKKTGFQDWLRTQNANTSLQTDQKLSEAVQKPVGGDSDRK